MSEREFKGEPNIYKLVPRNNEDTICNLSPKETTLTVDKLANMMNGSLKDSSLNQFTEDSILPKRHLYLESAFLNKHGRLAVVINQRELEYPAEWLRYNCCCGECYNHTCLSFNAIMMNVGDSTIKLKSVSMTKGGVECLFIDDHAAEFSTEFLYNRRMTDEGCKERAEHIFVHKITLWPSPDKMKVKKYSYEQVTETSEGLETFTGALIRDGIVIITDTPDKEIYLELAEKTGLLPLPSQYGTSFKVMSNPSPTNIAFTSSALDFHVDMAYAQNYPGVQFLHCMKQAKVGGENMMSDGVKVALILKDKYPDYYKILTTTKMQWKDVVAHPNTQHFYMAGCFPVITVGDDGVPTHIRISETTHSSFFPGSVEEYEKFSEARRVFYNLLWEYSIQLKSSAGDILVFDNQRVLHGRLKFSAAETRYLEVWYAEWDLVHSSYRTSKIKSANK